MLTHVPDLLRNAGVGTIRLVSDADGMGDLNFDVTKAARLVQAEGAAHRLLVTADLPYLAADDIADLVDPGRQSLVVIAEAKDGGANALLLRPPAVLAFATGQPSARRHAKLARAVGNEPVIVRQSGLARDIDTPADLAALASNHPTYRVYRHVA